MKFLKSIAVIILIAAVAFSIPNNTIYAADEQVGILEQGIIKGVVKENNPSLGYITLYFEDGSGSDADEIENLISLRTFTYGYDVTVIREGNVTLAESIQPGDQVFIKLDNEGYIQKISAKSFYKPVYGTIQYKGSSWIIIKKDEGTFENYTVSGSTAVYRNGKLSSISELLAGERIKLLVQTDGLNQHIASIELSKTEHLITGILRGTVEYLDLMGDCIIVSNVQEFVNGYWMNSPFIGIQSFKYSHNYKDRPLPRVSGKVYFATQKSADGTDRIVKASYRQDFRYETVFKDNLLGLAGDRIQLANSSDTIRFSEDTIVVKDGKLVDISAINNLNPIKISLERENTGYYAHLLTCDSVNNNGLDIYRGRIKNVEPQVSITLESFARLSDVTWEFTNTPKTLDIDLSVTRFIHQNGVGNMREFTQDYEGQTFYMVANGTKIELISTAPYADSPVQGRISTLTGQGLRLTETMEYDIAEDLWIPSEDTYLQVPVNAIVLKDGKIGTISLLKLGDEIKVIRHSQNHEGILIICN